MKKIPYAVIRDDVQMSHASDGCYHTRFWQEIEIFLVFVLQRYFEWTCRRKGHITEYENQMPTGFCSRCSHSSRKES